MAAREIVWADLGGLSRIFPFTVSDRIMAFYDFEAKGLRARPPKTRRATGNQIMLKPVLRDERLPVLGRRWKYSNWEGML
jgi:hypothetical protein